jgi:hypothetical protein
MTDDLGSLAEGWIKLYDAVKIYGDKAREDDALFWAFMKLDKLCTENPAQALKVITTILASTRDDLMLANLAAGPLETVLAHRGRDVIDEVERLAKSDPRVRELLKGVWQNLMDDETWGRVQKAAHGGILENH